MIDLIGALLDAFVLWGIIIGLAVAAVLAYLISKMVWGEFHMSLFGGLAIPCVIVGVYVQHKLENTK